MAIAVPKGAQRKLIPAKSFLACIVGIYDIGHRDGTYGPYHQAVFVFELHTQRGPLLTDEGKPTLISGFYDVVQTKKGKPSPLKKLIEAINGPTAAFDITADLLDKPLRVAIEHVTKNDGSIRDNVGATSQIDEDDRVPKAQTSAEYFEIDRDYNDISAIKRAKSRVIPPTVPEWVAKQINTSLEFAAKGAASTAATEEVRPAGNPLAAAAVADDDSDLPF